MTNNDIATMIKKYKIWDVGDGRICIQVPNVSKKELDQIVSSKPEILQYFNAIREEEMKQEAARMEREAARKEAIESIPGVKEIRAASQEYDDYREEFSRCMERGDGILPATPKTDLDALRKQYPGAVFVLELYDKTHSANDEISAIARKAYSALADGESVETVKAQYDADMDAFSEKHIWD